MYVEPMDYRHLRRLFEIAREAEGHDCPEDYERFEQLMLQREGFVIFRQSTGEMVGCITFSNYVPETNVIIHCFVMKKYQRRWATRKILRQVAGYTFEYLGLPRVSGYCVKGVNDWAGEFLERIGFRHEGTVRKGWKRGNEYYDIKLYGLLREECRWLENVRK